jgi:hypothetical protein
MNETVEQGIREGSSFCGEPVPEAVPLLPKDNVFLRPLQTPIWDTEVYNPMVPVRKLPFFDRPIGQPMTCYDAGVKTALDTCLAERGKLSDPLQFSLCGFRVCLERGVSEENASALINGGVFRFALGGRELAAIPMEIIPQVTTRPRDAETLADHYAALVQLMSNPEISWAYLTPLVECARSLIEAHPYHRFTIGRSALKLDSREAFSASIVWNEPPVVSRPVRIMVVLVGLYWKPLKETKR